MLSLPSESKPAALTAASDLKKLDRGHYRAAQDQAEVSGKPAKSGVSLVVIFSRQGCNLLANQLKLPLEERTSGVKQDELFNFIMSLEQSIKVSHLFPPKLYTRSVFHRMTTNLLTHTHTHTHTKLVGAHSLDLFAL